MKTKLVFMNDLKFDILLPTYNGGKILGDTLRSILSQSFTNYDIIICDDCSTDDTELVAKSFFDSRIKFHKNEENLGYPGNLERCRQKATGDIVYLMGQDDILGQDVLLNTYNAFKRSSDIGAVTRPYFWFEDDVNTPVRAKNQLNVVRDEVVTMRSDFSKILILFSTLDQLSGLALRRELIDCPFHPDIFTCHIYPFASIFKKHAVVFLKDYSVAVRIATSCSRGVSSVYNKSPLQSWVDLFTTVFSELEFAGFKHRMIKEFATHNFIGLIQIRNYAEYRYFWREVFLLLKYRWKNILHPFFWIFFLGCVVTPPCLLIPLVTFFKVKLNSRRYTNLKFTYRLI